MSPAFSRPSIPTIERPSTSPQVRDCAVASCSHSPGRRSSSRSARASESLEPSNAPAVRLWCSRQRRSALDASCRSRSPWRRPLDGIERSRTSDGCSPARRGTRETSYSIAATADRSTPDAFGRAFRAARDAARLDGVRLHDLRHGFASMLVGAGTNVRVVSDLLGHATVGFTLVYTHPREEDAAAAIAEAERLIGGGV